MINYKQQTDDLQPHQNAPHRVLTHLRWTPVQSISLILDELHPLL